MPYRLDADKNKILLTDEEIAAKQQTSEQLAERERHRRDSLLQETDVWALSDRTMTQAQIDYRQALRDVTSQEGFPETITWPEKPE